MATPGSLQSGWVWVRNPSASLRSALTVGRWPARWTANTDLTFSLVNAAQRADPDAMSLPISLTPAAPEAAPGLRQLWWLFLILGLLSIVVGFLALSATFVATMASVLVFGVLLLIAGVSEVVHALMVRK